MENLNILSTLSDNKSNKTAISTDFVEFLKNQIKANSIVVEITVKNIDNMLGVKVVLRNPNQQLDSRESGVDFDLIDAILMATINNYDYLKNYDPTGKYVLCGDDTKFQVFSQLLNSSSPVKLQLQGVEDGKKIIEVDFQLGYRRKVKFYFAEKDEKVRAKLIEAGLLSNE